MTTYETDLVVRASGPIQALNLNEVWSVTISTPQKTAPSDVNMAMLRKKVLLTIHFDTEESANKAAEAISDVLSSGVVGVTDIVI